MMELNIANKSYKSWSSEKAGLRQQLGCHRGCSWNSRGPQNVLSVRTRMHCGRTQLLSHICEELASLLPGCLLSLHGSSQAAAQARKLRGCMVLHQLQSVLNAPVLCGLHKCTHRPQFGFESCVYFF